MSLHTEGSRSRSKRDWFLLHRVVAIASFAATLTAILSILLSMMGALPAIHGIYLFLGSVVASIVLSFILSKMGSLALDEFKRRVVMVGDNLVLDSELDVEFGRVEVGYWIRRVGKHSTVNTFVNIEPVYRKTTSVISLSELCSGPFYLFKSGEDFYVAGPGFKIANGKYKGVAVLCLDPSKIQPRQVTLSLGDHESGDAVGEVSITTSGVVGRVKWTYRATTVHIPIYDEKTGLYRIQERPLSKPKARSVRLEICGEAPFTSRCFTLVNCQEPNRECVGDMAGLSKRKIVFVYKQEPSTIQSVAGEFRDGLIGYQEGKVKAKLVLDIPLGRDVVNSVEI